MTTYRRCQNAVESRQGRTRVLSELGRLSSGMPKWKCLIPEEQADDLIKQYMEFLELAKTVKPWNRKLKSAVRRAQREAMVVAERIQDIHGPKAADENRYHRRFHELALRLSLKFHLYDRAQIAVRNLVQIHRQEKQLKVKAPLLFDQCISGFLEKGDSWIDFLALLASLADVAGFYPRAIALYKRVMPRWKDSAQERLSLERRQVPEGQIVRQVAMRIRIISCYLKLSDERAALEAIEEAQGIMKAELPIALCLVCDFANRMAGRCERNMRQDLDQFGAQATILESVAQLIKAGDLGAASLSFARVERFFRKEVMLPGRIVERPSSNRCLRKS